MTQLFETISGNPAAIDKLTLALAERRIVAFVGAGASAGLYPLWAGLIRRLAEVAMSEGLATAEDVLRWTNSQSCPATQAAAEIKQVLGPGLFGQSIRQIFSPPQQGLRFTPIHEALLRLGCLGYVTTNYDVCLLATRNYVYPTLAVDRGTTWDDPDNLNRWVTRDIFDEVQHPVLFAHGTYDRGKSVILGEDDYRTAYAPGLFRVVVERLWCGERLLFVGFGFNDPWLDFVASEILERVQAFRTDEPRHTAIVGLREGEDPVAMRRGFRERFNARIIFYPVILTPDGKESHQELLSLLHLLIERSSVLAARPLYPSSDVWHVPHHPTYAFIGNAAFIDTVERELTRNCRVAINGMPGIGKTEVALQLAYRWRAAKRVAAVLWCRAETEEELTTDLAAIATKLGLIQADRENAAPLYKASLCKGWLEHHADWLLILDNVERWSIVEHLLPSDGGKYVLVTTRSAAVAASLPSIPVPSLSLADGAELLMTRANRNAFLTEDHAASLAIAADLGGLPLALVVAGRSIAISQTTPERYRRLLEAEGIRALDISNSSEERSVASAVRIAFDRLAEAHSEGADLIRLCSFFAPDAVPEELIELGLGCVGINQSVDARVAAAGEHGFVRRDSADRTLTIHRIVHAVVRDQMTLPFRLEWANRAVVAVAKAFPDPRMLSDWPECERLLAHAQSCFSWIDLLRIASPDAARLLDSLGYYLDERGQYEKVEPIYRLALNIRLDLFGPEHPDFATSLSNLAWHYRARGRYELAQPMYERALAIRRKILGDQALETASSMNMLAMMYQDRGRFEEAEGLLQAALEIRLHSLGPDHPKTAAIENNLGWLLSEIGKSEKAFQLLEEALRIRNKTWPAGHPDTAATLNILGFLWRRHGDLEKAARYTSDGLAMRMNVLGSEHPETASSMNSLAEILLKNDRVSEAESLFKSSRRILERAHCELNPEMAWSLRGLAVVATSRADCLEADRLYSLAVEIAEATLGISRYDVVNLRDEREAFRVANGL